MKLFLIFNNGDTLSIGKSFVKLHPLNFTERKKGLFSIKKSEGESGASAGKIRTIP
jgi:hypothetical protein